MKGKNLLKGNNSVNVYSKHEKIYPPYLNTTLSCLNNSSTYYFLFMYFAIHK